MMLAVVAGMAYAVVVVVAWVVVEWEAWRMERASQHEDMTELYRWLDGEDEGR